MEKGVQGYWLKMKYNIVVKIKQIRNKYYQDIYVKYEKGKNNEQLISTAWNLKQTNCHLKLFFQMRNNLPEASENTNLTKKSHGNMFNPIF